MIQHRRCLAVILAAGEGTRMKSSLPKVLHPIGGRPLIAHTLATARTADIDAIAAVVGPGRDDVVKAVRTMLPEAEVFVQTERRGTAHAVLAARDAIVKGYDDILVLYADVPLVLPDTLRAMRAMLAGGAAVVALGFEAADPQGYGRLLTTGSDLLAIREHKDATESERAIRLCNSGIMGLGGADAVSILDAIGCDNAQGEYYLTDAVEVARGKGLRCMALVTGEAEVMGVNDRVQLAAAEAMLQRRLRDAAMRGGTTLMAPETVFMSVDTVLGRDVVVEPHVVFGVGVTVEQGAVIHAFSHLEGAHVGPGASVGPYGRLRPGARLRRGAKVGNFVEIKSADIGEGAKVSHLTYIGDATVGAGSNVGAGTVTCNYDGFGKYRTEIGAEAFIGSNSSLVAPVTIGRGAFVGSGSVITVDVPADALALGRTRQTTKDGWATSFRARQRPRKG